MISGYLYKVTLNGHTVTVVMKEDNGDGLVDFAKLAAVEDRDWDGAEDWFADARLNKVERISEVWVESAVLADA